MIAITNTILTSLLVLCRIKEDKEGSRARHQEEMVFRDFYVGYWHALEEFMNRPAKIAGLPSFTKEDMEKEHVFRVAIIHWIDKYLQKNFPKHPYNTTSYPWDIEYEILNFPNSIGDTGSGFTTDIKVKLIKKKKWKRSKKTKKKS